MSCGHSQQCRWPLELLPSSGVGAWGDALVPRWGDVAPAPGDAQSSTDRTSLSGAKEALVCWVALQPLCVVGDPYNQLSSCKYT